MKTYGKWEPTDLFSTEALKAELARRESEAIHSVVSNTTCNVATTTTAHFDPWRPRAPQCPVCNVPKKPKPTVIADRIARGDTLKQRKPQPRRKK